MLYLQIKKYNKGFTLIELLVVISIIGLLSSIVLASLSTVRQKALIAKAVQEADALGVALELYHNDNGVYPSPNMHQTVLSTKLKPYIQSIMPSFIEGIPGVDLYSSWGTGNRIYWVNKKTYNWSLHCGDAGPNSSYGIYFIVPTSQKNIIEGNFPQLRYSNGNHYVNSNGSYYCVNEPPK